MVQLTRQADALNGTLDESSAVDGGLVVEPTHLSFTGSGVDCEVRPREEDDDGARH